MSGREIRGYEESDREWLISAVERLQAHMATQDPLQRLHVGPGYAESATKALLTEQPGSSCVLILLENGERLGFIAGYAKDFDARTRLAMRATRVGVLSDIFVEDRARRRGVGADLAAALEQWLIGDGAEELYVHAMSYNAASIGLFTECGFESREVSLMKPVSP